MRIQGQSIPGKGGRYKARESGLRLAFLLEERRLSWSEPPWEEGMEEWRSTGWWGLISVHLLSLHMTQKVFLHFTLLTSSLSLPTHRTEPEGDINLFPTA